MALEEAQVAEQQAVQEGGFGFRRSSPQLLEHFAAAGLGPPADDGVEVVDPAVQVVEGERWLDGATGTETAQERRSETDATLGQSPREVTDDEPHAFRARVEQQFRQEAPLLESFARRGYLCGYGNELRQQHCWGSLGHTVRIAAHRTAYASKEFTIRGRARRGLPVRPVLRHSARGLRRVSR